MAVRYISTRLAIEGEEEYQRKIKVCKDTLSGLKSELAIVTSEFIGNANSMEALSAKSQVLGKMYDAQKTKINAYSQAVEGAKKSQDAHGAAIETYKIKIASAEAELSKLKATGDGTSEAQKKLSMEIEKLNREMSVAEAKYAAAGKAANGYQTSLNYAQADINKLSSEIKQNDAYLLEAKASADGCASGIDKYGKAAKDASAAMSGAGKDIADFSEAVEKSTEKTSVFADIVSGNIISGGIEKISDAAKTATKELYNVAAGFETSMAKVSTIADTSLKSLDELSGEAVQLSNTTGVSAKEISNSLYEAISAGADTADAMTLVETAVKSAKGGFTDTATAVDGLTSSLNAYGMSSRDSEKVANMMLITQNKGKTTFGEISKSIGNVAPIAHSAKMGLNELLASIAALTAQGVATSEAVTGIKAALSNVIKPSKEAAELAEQLGIDFSVAALQTDGWAGFLEKLSLATGGNISTMGKLFGSTEALNSVLSLTSKDGFALMSETMSEMQTNFSALDDAYSKMSQTTEERMKRVQTSFENLGITVGEKVLPIIQPALEWIADNSGIVAGGFVTIAGAVTGYKIAVGIATVATQVFGATAATAAAISGVGLLIGAVGGLIALIGTLCIDFDETSEAVKELTSATDAATDTFDRLNKSQDDTIAKTEASVRVADTYISRLETLEKQTAMTSDEQREYELIVEKLAGIFPELNLKIDEQSGLLDGGTTALRENISAWKEHAIAEAMAEALREKIKAQIDAEIELEKNRVTFAKNEAERAAASAEIERLQAEINAKGAERMVEGLNNTSAASEKLRREDEDLTNAMHKLEVRYAELGVENSTLTSSIDKGATAVGEMTEDVELSETAVKNLSAQLGVTEEELEGFASEAKNTGDNVAMVADATADEVTDALRRVRANFGDLTEDITLAAIQWSKSTGKSLQEMIRQMEIYAAAAQEALSGQGLAVNKYVIKTIESAGQSWERYPSYVKNYALVGAAEFEGVQNTQGTVYAKLGEKAGKSYGSGAARGAKSAIKEGAGKEAEATIHERLDTIQKNLADAAAAMTRAMGEAGAYGGAEYVKTLQKELDDGKITVKKLSDAYAKLMSDTTGFAGTPAGAAYLQSLSDALKNAENDVKQLGVNVGAALFGGFDQKIKDEAQTAPGKLADGIRESLADIAETTETLDRAAEERSGEAGSSGAKKYISEMRDALKARQNDVTEIQEQLNAVLSEKTGFAGTESGEKYIEKLQSELEQAQEDVDKLGVSAASALFGGFEREYQSKVDEFTEKNKSALAQLQQKLSMATLFPDGGTDASRRIMDEALTSWDKGNSLAQKAADYTSTATLSSETAAKTNLHERTPISITQNIYARETSFAGQQREAAKQFEDLVRRRLPLRGS